MWWLKWDVSFSEQRIFVRPGCVLLWSFTYSEGFGWVKQGGVEVSVWVFKTRMMGEKNVISQQDGGQGNEERLRIYS